MDAEQFIEISNLVFKGYEYKNVKILELPTGVKQILASLLVSSPKIVLNIHIYNNNDEYNQLICDNIELYKMLWNKYISTKPLKYNDLMTVKKAYIKAAKFYENYATKILNKGEDEIKNKDKYKNKYNILYKNSKNTYKSMFKNTNRNKGKGINMLYVNKLVYYDQTDNIGSTLLMIACMNDNSEAIKYLINKGANVLLQNELNQTALELYLRDTNPEIDIVNLLLKNSAGKIKSNVLFKNFNQKDNIPKRLFIAQMLIDNGVDVNWKDEENDSLLFKINCSEYTSFLINNGIDVNYENFSSKLTPLKFITHNIHKYTNSNIKSNTNSNTNSNIKSIYHYENNFKYKNLNTKSILYNENIKILKMLIDVGPPKVLKILLILP